MTIWKYDVAVGEVQMPEGAKPLAVQLHDGQVRLWVLCDPTKPLVPRLFRIYGTGHVLPDNPGTYIGTYQVLAGRLVYHLFEETK